MNETELQREIIRMLAKERGVKQDRITPASRLAEDLGMYGDDAVDFFHAFEKRFGVDLAALWPHLADYFGTEGYPLVAGLGLLAMAGFAGVVAGIVPGPPWLSGTVMFVACMFIAERIRQRHRQRRGAPAPITVQDLLEAATAKRWVKPFELHSA